MEKYTKEISREKALSALNSINPDCSYKVWCELFAACVSTRCLTSEDFATWSSGYSESPPRSEIIKKWNTFKPDGKIKPGTLFHYAKESGWRYVKNPSYFPFKSESKELPEQSISYIPPAIIENEFAREIWDRCVPADENHGYIKRKKGLTDGVRVYPMDAPDIESISVTDQKRVQRVQGWLAVPCWLEGKLQAIQFTHPEDEDAKKPILHTTKKNGGWFTVNGTTEKIYIAEGIGHCWTLNQLTGCMAIHCFGSSELEKVSPSIRARYPDSELIIVSDVGMELKCEGIARKVNGLVLKLPEGLNQNYDINDYYIDHNKDATLKLIPSVSKPNLRYKGLRRDDISKLPDVDWLLEGVFPEQGFLVVFGKPGSGKSFLVIDLANALANGEKQWGNRDIKKSPVSYICLEGEGSFKHRISAWEKHHKKQISNDFVLYVEQFKLMTEGDSDLNDLAQAILYNSGENGLIIIDTLARAISSEDINTSKDMNQIIDSCKKLQRLTNSAVLLVHHCGKDTSKGMMGSNNLLGGADGVIEVILEKGQRSWHVYKSKDGVTGDRYDFETVSYVVGSREKDGVLKPINSCAIRHMGAKMDSDDEMPILKKKLNLTPPQQEILDLFMNQISSSLNYGKGNAPSHARCLSVDLFKRDAHALIKAKKLRNQDRTTVSAIESLIKKKLIGGDDEFLWELVSIVEK